MNNTAKQRSSPKEEHLLRSRMPLDLGNNLQMRFCGVKDVDKAIDSGRITGIENWKADSLWHAPAFPDLTFLQLVFGRRRCKELSDIYVDCNLDDHSALVLDSLFPPFKGTMWLGN